jgi:hypothetical protein
VVGVKTWATKKTVGAIAVAAAVAGVGGTAIAAATDSGSHGMSGGMHGGGPPPGGTPHWGDDQPEALHDEKVVADGHGGYETLLTQTGTVTAISPTSITARSDDGYLQTYVIRSVTTAPPPFHVDEKVTIDGKREGETAVVTTMRPPLSAGH